MKLVLISDTHERHEKVNVPHGDVLVHAGDFTMLGEEPYIADFNRWLGYLPHKRKVVIAGNHEMRWTPAKAAMLTNATYLQDSSCVIDGLKFYGSPYTPTFFDWAFMLPRGESMYQHWLKIPHDTDVLITHGPPKGKLDFSDYGKENVGCSDLAVIVEAIKPKLHVFGHIHGAYGQEQANGTTYVNASVVNEKYQPVNEPVVIDVEN